MIGTVATDEAEVLMFTDTLAVAGSRGGATALPPRFTVAVANLDPLHTTGAATILLVTRLTDFVVRLWVGLACRKHDECC